MAQALTDLARAYSDGPAVAGRARDRLLDLTGHLHTAAGAQLQTALRPLLDGATRRRQLGFDVDAVESGLLQAALGNPHLSAGDLADLLGCYDTGAAAAAVITPLVLRTRTPQPQVVTALLTAGGAGSAGESLVAELLAGEVIEVEHVPLLPWPVVATGYAHRSPTVAITVPGELYRTVEDLLAPLLHAPEEALTVLTGLGAEFTGTLAEFAGTAPALLPTA
jgi:hypothetical protein